MAKVFTRINQGFDALNFETGLTGLDVLVRFSDDNIDRNAVEDFVRDAKQGDVLQGVRYALVRAK